MSTLKALEATTPYITGAEEYKEKRPNLQMHLQMYHLLSSAVVHPGDRLLRYTSVNPLMQILCSPQGIL